MRGLMYGMVSMFDYRQRVAGEGYREGWERIFGCKRGSVRCRVCSCWVLGSDKYCWHCNAKVAEGEEKVDV